MTHIEAVEQMLVEQYLLGELKGAGRDAFEDHLFDCELCSADLKQGVAFLEAAKQEWKLAAPGRAKAVTAVRKNPLAWLWQPGLLGSALAACLAVVVYQSAVLLPQAHTELAEAQRPAVIEPLQLMAGTRGLVTLPTVALQDGFYALSLDISPAAHAAVLRCTLKAADGPETKLLDLSPEQAREAVKLRLHGAPGSYEVRVQSLDSAGNALGAPSLYAYTVVSAAH